MVLASFAVQLASAKVTDRPAAVVSRRQVQTELDTPTTAAASSVTTVPSASVVGEDATVPTSDPVPPSASLPVLTSPPSTARPGAPSTPGPTVGPSSTAAPSSTAVPTTTRPAGVSTTTSRPFDDGGHDGGGRDGRDGPGGGIGGGPFDGHDGPDPQPSPTTAPSATTTLTSQGGWVRVRCDGWSVSLASASPNPGYAMQVVDHGPQEVEVRFSSPSHESTVKARCESGSVRPDISEHGN